MSENTQKIIDLLATRRKENIQLAFALMASSGNVISAAQARPYHREYLPTLLRYVPSLLANERSISLVEQIIGEDWVSDWSGLTNLKTATLREVEFQSKHRFWEAISSAPALETLVLQDLHFDGVFPHNLSFSKLKRLWLTAVDLENVNNFCAIFANAAQLEELRIHNKKSDDLTPFSWNFSYFPQLKSVSIHHQYNRNRLHKFPEGIISLKQLEYLSLEFVGGASFTLPDSLKELKNLKTLKIRGVLIHHAKRTYVEERVRKLLPNCELIIL